MLPLRPLPSPGRSALLLTLLLAAFGAAGAQVSVTAPSERRVAPGEFVTLVFRVAADAPAEAELEGRSERGWTILRQPERLRLAPGDARPVALTVRVPEDAPAGAEDVVALRVVAGDAGAGAPAEASVRLVVEELRSVELLAPPQAGVEDGLGVTVRNAGNVPESLVLEVVRRDAGGPPERHELLLPPGAERRVEVALTAPGTLELRLEHADGALVARRVVEALGYGVPAPPPFRLSGDLRASLDSGGDVGLVLRLDGPLSDETDLDLRLDATEPLASSVALATDRFDLRLGAAATLPFRLGLAADPGAAVAVDLGDLRVGGALGWAGADVFGGLLGVELPREGGSAALAVGLRAGAPQAAARLAEARGPWELLGEAALQAGTLDAGLAVERNDPLGDLRLGGRLQRLGGPAGAAVAEVDGRDGLSSFRARLEVPLGPWSHWAWNAGIESRVPARVPGQLTLHAQAGLREAVVGLRHALPLREGWSVRGGLELFADEAGAGAAFRASGHVARSEAVALDLLSGATWRPDAGLAVDELRLRARSRDEALSVHGDARWDPVAATLAGTAGATLVAAAWRLGLTVGGTWEYEGEDRFAGTIGLRSRYAFGVDVPESVVERAGGRRLAEVRGVVTAAGRPLPGAEVRIGRYRLRTDEDGGFAARVEPGEVRVQLVLAGLPITLRPVDAPLRELELAARETAELRFELEETAALRGRVRVDDDADGVPDAPPRGVPATLRVRDAEGRLRAVRAEEDGGFVLLGLPPGPTVVTLEGLPSGAVPTSAAELELSLAGGDVGEVLFAVQLPAARARSFGGDRPRVRRAEAEVPGVPPGTLPLVFAEVQGETDEVLLVSDGATVPMAFDGERWRARLAVPQETPAGLLRFEVRARRGDEVASRRGQVVVDESLPAVEVDPGGPGRPGGTLEVRVAAYLPAERVTVRSPFGPPVAATEVAPGRWRADLRVPAGAEDAVHDLTVEVVPTGDRADGGAIKVEARVRVLPR